MKRIPDRLVTGFFVVVLGMLWYFTTRHNVRSDQRCKIVIYDIFGKQININEIRTDFSTRNVACSYILEYQKRFPHYSFSMAFERIV